MASNYSKRGFGIVVFHRDEGLFIASHKVHQFHHSSFLAGSRVHFAGEMKIQAGVLIIITNKSGHYKPGDSEALTMLTYLKKSGVDLETVEFRVVRRDGQYRSIRCNDYLKELQAGHKPQELP